MRMKNHRYYGQTLIVNVAARPSLVACEEMWSVDETI